MRDHPGEIHRLEDLRGIKFVGVFRIVARLSLSLSHVGKTMTQILEPLFDIPHAPVPAFVAPPPPAAPVQVPSVIPIEWLNSWSVVDWLQSIKLSQCAHTLSGPTRLMATDAEQFIANGFDQFVSVKDLTNEDLDLIGVKLPGHKKALVSLRLSLTLCSRLAAARVRPASRVAGEGRAGRSAPTSGSTARGSPWT